VNLTLSNTEKGVSVFKPRARLLELLGDQLITNDAVAIIELIKNAFDADATTATVTLMRVANREEGEIVVEDDGTGMSLDTILDVWFELGTVHRKAQRDRGERSAVYNRPLLGEKGIGRLAVHRIGNIINLITRAKDSEKEVAVEVNWLMFGHDKYLEEIPIQWTTRRPKIFNGEKHGTMLIIKDLKKAWTHGMVRNLQEKTDALQAPLKETYNFEIKLSAPEYPEIEKREKIPLENILDTALYSLTGFIDENGSLQAVYRFRHKALPTQSRNSEIKEDLRHRDKRFTQGDGVNRQPGCGPFNLRVYAWDLDPATLKETVSRVYYEKEIRPRTGVRVHRDSFRVLPYGEPGNDWLNLDIRRVNNPTKCVSNNQVIGIINISGNNNPKLADKTDREGIIENEAFEDFRSLVLSAINEFEVEREKDKTGIASLQEKKRRRINRTTEAIDSLKEKMNERKDYALYENQIKKIENAYDAEVRDVLEPILVSATLGHAYLMPAHEIIHGIQDLEGHIRNLESELKRIGVGGRMAEAVAPMWEIVKMLREVANGALELAQRKSNRFSLRSAVDLACHTKEPSLNAERVKVRLIERHEVTIQGQKNLVIASVLNLIDNSLYWLSDVKDKVLQISIDHDTTLNPRIVVSDNGPGIRKEDQPFLGEAFWTRKPSGTGLGLYITKRAMEINNGELDFGFHGEEPDFLVGANVILRFKPEAEIKR